MFSRLESIKVKVITVGGTLKKVCSKFKGRIAVYSVLTLIGSAANVLSPYILIKALSASLTITTSSLVLIGASGLALTGGLMIPVVRNKLLVPMNEYFSTLLAKKVARHFFTLSLDYQLSAPTGRVSLLITKCYYSVIKLIPSGLGNIIPTAIEGLTAAVVLTYFYGPIGLSQFGILVLFSGSAAVGARWITVAQKEELDQGFAFAGQYQGIFNNFENAHYFGRVKDALHNFAGSANQFAKKMSVTSSLIGNSTLRQLTILGLGFLGTTVYSAYRVTQGSLTPADFFVINLYGTQFMLKLARFSTAVNRMQTAIADTRLIVDFLNEKSDVEDDPHAPDLAVTRPEAAIRFQDVCFSYKTKPILDKVNFEVAPGQKVAIVGLSGEGKSTILKLLLRFYESTSGTISIAGQNIREVNLTSLRASVAVVPQNAVLFNDTIEENIRYGNSKASERDIEQAATHAGLMTFIKAQAQGFKTRVGEQGGMVSGGERQRIATARAIIKGAPILFFDEATSALDIKTEREVQENLDRISAGYTTLSVTHRLTTIMNADKIMYLRNGKIQEQGTYSELMAQKGLFYQQLVEHCDSLGIGVESLKPLSAQLRSGPPILLDFKRVESKEGKQSASSGQLRSASFSVQSGRKDDSKSASARGGRGLREPLLSLQQEDYNAGAGARSPKSRPKSSRATAADDMV